MEIVYFTNGNINISAITENKIPKMKSLLEIKIIKFNSKYKLSY